MAKKYEIPQNSVQMVEESTPSYALQYNYNRQMNVHGSENAAWEAMANSNPKLNVSVDKLRQMGRECINASCISAEEAIKHFMSM